MNYRIAIVEDNQKDAEMLAQHFAKFEKENPSYHFALERFETGDQFLFQYHPVYDMVILDISMPGTNGMDVAAALRQIDRTVLLIFVTSLASYAVRGYEVDAFDFVLKPVTYPSFTLKMKRALNRLQPVHGEELLIRLRDGFRRLPASQIIYVEILDHDLRFHTLSEEVGSYGNLKQIEQALDSRLFCRCSSSYLVNLSYVQSVRGSTVFVGGVELPLSRSKRKAFIEALNNYVGGNFS